MDDLYLKFQFTDRGGKRVYNIHEPIVVSISPEQVEDKVTGYAPLPEVQGQIRIHPDRDDCDVDWAEEQETD